MNRRNRDADSGVQSIQRAAAILRCFAQTDFEMGVTAISKHLGLHKSTVSRLLSTLQQEGFVEKNPETGKYRLGLELVTLAGVVLEQIDLRTIAKPHLIALSEITRETVNILILSGAECMNVAGVPSSKPIQYIGRIGRRSPLHCTSAGKILLAYMPSGEWERLLPAELPPFTPQTTVTLQELELELLQIRRQGYAITHEEHQVGLSAIAAPIFNHVGQVIAAVAVSGPSYRMGPGEIEKYVVPVQETAHNISVQLGYAAG